MATSRNEQPTGPLPIVRRVPASPVPPRRRRAWAPIALGLVGLLMVGCLVVAGYVLTYRDRVLPGVQVADVEVGGLREAEATALLNNRLTAYASRPLTLTVGGQEWSIPPRDLGVRYDVSALIDEAMALGRRGSAQERLAVWWPFGRRPAPLPLTGSLDQATLVSGLKPVLTVVNQPPTDATIVITPDAAPGLASARPGQTLDLTGATLLVRQRAAALSVEPVSLRVLPVAPVVTDQALAPIGAAMTTLLRQPFTIELTSAGEAPRRWEIAPADLTAMMTLTGPDYRALALDEGRLTIYLARLTPEIERPSRAAELSLDARQAPVIAPHMDGLAFDLAASATAINQAAAEGRSQASLVTRVIRPALTTADLEPLRDDLLRLLDRTVTVSAAGTSERLTRKELTTFLTVHAPPGAAARPTIGVNREEVTDHLATLAKQVNRPARPPVLKYLNGQVTRTTEPVQGRTLDEAAALTALSEGLLSPTTTSITLPVKLIDAPLTTVDPRTIVIRDVLAQGSTYYGFSLPERKHNVELATQRLNGTLVAPGDLFSFNRAVGRVNTASGYKTGYGIVLTNGAVQTVPSVGGGICQVATTVFHAAFRSGAPIGERNWHFYWIPTYGQAPSGLTGLDATVDEDYGLDFTFRNTTGNWIALETGFDGQTMRVTLKGVNPGWEVRVDGPKISNVKPHDPTPVEREDPTLAPGRRLQVESARDGMDVAITRTVLQGGQTIDQRTFRSHYEPSQNVTLVGPREPGRVDSGQ